MLEYVDKSLTLAIMEHTHNIYIHTLKITVYNFLLGDSTAEEKRCTWKFQQNKDYSGFRIGPPNQATKHQQLYVSEAHV